MQYELCYLYPTSSNLQKSPCVILVVRYVRNHFTILFRWSACLNNEYSRVNVRALDVSQGAFHVVNPEDLRREIELLLGVAAYSLLPWRGGTTLFCFTRRKRDGVVYNYYK